jgi:ribose transport system permease protein
MNPDKARDPAAPTLTVADSLAQAADSLSLAQEKRRLHRRRVLTLTGADRFAALYVLAALFIVFSVVEPSTFPTFTTLQSVFNEYSINAIVALGVTVPLAAGVFDLSVGSVVGLSGITAAWLLGNTGLSSSLVILLVTVGGVAIGVVNAVLVIRLGLDSFIATLATGSLFSAAAIGLSGDQILSNKVTGSFSHTIATSNFHGFAIPGWIAIIAMILVGLLLERTTIGRHIYAIGFSPDVAATVGVRVGLIRAGTFVVSAVLACIAGMALTGTVGGADPSVGPEYLLGAFAAAFLGATQVRPGRFNTWGTALATLLLGYGAVGLLLTGASTWAPDAFEGVVLIVAIWLATRAQRAK